MRSVLALAAAVVLSAPAAAQTRYDHDGAWVYESIRQERARERRAARREARFYRGDYRERERRYHWVEHARRYYPRDSPDGHPSTRVYGAVLRGAQFVQRNATSHIECFSPVEDQGGAHSNENAAQADAELSWSAKVMGMYGAIFADFRNASDRTKTCYRATFDQSFVARNTEALAQYIGGAGYKTICKITAKPCQARPQVIDVSREEKRTGTGDQPTGARR